MRNLKKALILLLSLAMMLSIMVVGAGAAFPDQKDIAAEHADAVNMCVALKIIEGNTDGTFAPKENVTREQMAKMICVLDNGGKVPQGATGNTFKDVPADRWSNPFIETCAARGVVVGVGNQMFNPAGNVTASQAAKMLLVELGYNDVQQRYTGPTWATYVNIDASTKGYYEDLEDVDVNAPLSREHAAQMIWNALQAKEVEYGFTLVTNADGSVSSMVVVNDRNNEYINDRGERVIDKISLLEDKYEAKEFVFYMDGIDYTSHKSEYTYFGYDKDMNALPVGKGYTTTQDYSELFGQKVKAVVKLEDNTVYGIVPHKSHLVTTTVWGDIDKTNAVKDNKVEINDETYKTDNWTKMDYYEFCSDPEPISAKDVENWYTVKAIDNTDNDKMDTIVSFPVTIEKVTYVSATKVTTSSGDKYTFEDDDIYENVKKNDWVVITHAGNEKTGTNTIEKADLVSGKVTANKGTSGVDYKVRINGEWYKQAVAQDGDLVAGANTDKRMRVDPPINDRVQLVVYNGYYFYVDVPEANLNVAVITDIGNYDYREKNIEMSLMMTDGTIEDVLVDKLMFGYESSEDGFYYDGRGNVVYEGDYFANDIKGEVDYKYDDFVGMPVTFDVSKGVYTLTIVDGYTADMDKVDLTEYYTTDNEGRHPHYYADYKSTWITREDGYEVVFDKNRGEIFVGTHEILEDKDWKNAVAEYDVSDNAMIVVEKMKQTDYGWEHDKFSYMTGEELLSHSNYRFDASDIAIVLNDDNEIVALIAYASGKSISTGEDTYAYVVDAYVDDNDEGDSAVFFDVINDKEKTTIETDLNTNGDYAAYKGTIITYTLDNNDVASVEDKWSTSAVGAMKSATTKGINVYYSDFIEDGVRNDETRRIMFADDAVIVAMTLDEEIEDSTYTGTSIGDGGNGWILNEDQQFMRYQRNVKAVIEDNEIVAVFFNDGEDTEFDLNIDEYEAHNNSYFNLTDEYAE